MEIPVFWLLWIDSPSTADWSPTRICLRLWRQPSLCSTMSPGISAFPKILFPNGVLSLSPVYGRTSSNSLVWLSLSSGYHPQTNGLNGHYLSTCPTPVSCPISDNTKWTLITHHYYLPDTNLFDYFPPIPLHRWFPGSPSSAHLHWSSNLSSTIILGCVLLLVIHEFLARQNHRSISFLHCIKNSTHSCMIILCVQFAFITVCN